MSRQYSELQENSQKSAQELRPPNQNAAFARRLSSRAHFHRSEFCLYSFVERLSSRAHFLRFLWDVSALVLGSIGGWGVRTE